MGWRREYALELRRHCDRGMMRRETTGNTLKVAMKVLAEQA
jgi:hypothetical protein